MTKFYSSKIKTISTREYYAISFSRLQKLVCKLFSITPEIPKHYEFKIVPEKFPSTQLSDLNLIGDNRGVFYTIVNATTEFIIIKTRDTAINPITPGDTIVVYEPKD